MLEVKGKMVWLLLHETFLKMYFTFHGTKYRDEMTAVK